MSTETLIFRDAAPNSVKTLNNLRLKSKLILNSLANYGLKWELTSQDKLKCNA